MTKSPDIPSLSNYQNRLSGNSTIIDDLNTRLLNVGIEFELDRNCIDLSSVKKHDLILNISLHEDVSKIAYEYMNELEEVDPYVLQLACRYNWHHVTLLLLERDVRVDIREEWKEGESPLMIAAFYNFTSIAKLLIEYNADVSRVAPNGRTALHFAAQHGNEELCRLLLNQSHYTKPGGKNNINEKDRTGKTPLHLAMLAGQRGRKVTSLLIEKGASITIKDLKDCGCALTMAAGEGSADLIEMLLNKVPQSEKKKIQDEMDDALFIAVQAGSEQAVKTLIHQGANVHAVMKDGKLTPLHVAAINGQACIVTTLLKNEAHRNAIDHRDMTPFHRACLNGHLEIVKMSTWEKNTYLTAIDINCNIPIMLAILNGRDKVVEYLIEMHDKLHVKMEAKDKKGRNILHKAVESNQPKVLQLILSKADSAKTLINNKDVYNCTPLLHAAHCDNEKFVDVLVAYGASTTDIDEKMQTPLHIASKLGYINVIRSLLKANGGKANDHARLSSDVYGNTPLHNATDQGGLQTVEVLLEKCDNLNDVINAVNCNNETPLHFACRRNNMDCVTYLLRKGADISIKTKRNKTCLDEAAERNNTDMCTLLITNKKTIDVLWNAEKSICCIETLIEEYPKVAEEVLDQCCIKKNEKECEYLFRIIDELDHNRNTFAPAIMESCSQDDLITHDVTKKLILRKWNRFGRWIYFIWFIINAVYTSFLTALVITAKHEENKLGGATNSTCQMTKDSQFQAFPWVILVMVVLYVLTQIVYIYHLRRRYFTPANLFSLVVSVFTFLFILPFVACQFDEMQQLMKGKEDLQWQFGSLAILLSWVNLLFHFKHLFYGIYVEMLTEVLKSWLKIIAVFCILIIGFALSFHCILDEKTAFEKPANAIIKTIVWMIGEVEYDNVFIASKLKYHKVSLFILIVFFIVMNITFINLLVGLAVGDIDAVQKKAFLILLKEKINALEVLHNCLPSFFRKKLHEKRYIDRRNHGIFSRLSDRFGNVMMKKLEQDFYAEQAGEANSLRRRKASWRRGAVRS